MCYGVMDIKILYSNIFIYICSTVFELFLLSCNLCRGFDKIFSLKLAEFKLFFNCTYSVFNTRIFYRNSVRWEDNIWSDVVARLVA